ncbi:DUF445 domain-containing protein [Paracidovorax konjaci]|uniref:Uncharacterized membrane-anchored protein YjiN, DUF445 family n=1 Tax=Paracidovorax konjaci TaxID=32040 RepID=A0A1I1V8S8_9BURK|nr:DUF445 domain-containing protein [Paracidovorax konjaci]SFD79461.1 Uncharacterized membrane-anchored protein YjiN, DUF445 family [Paracidovorax konjaci]
MDSSSRNSSAGEAGPRPGSGALGAAGTFMAGLPADEGFAASPAATERALALAHSKWLASGLLLAVTAVFAATYAFPPSLLVECIRAMAEAAMVGALADWFAVSALFRRIPLPWVQRHTNIIARNKDRIGGNLAAFVRDKFLDAPSLVTLIQRHDPADMLAQWLTSSGNAQLLGRQVARLALAALDTVEDARIQRFMNQAARALVGQLDLSRTMAAALETLTHGGRHQVLLDDVLSRVTVLLRSPETRTFIAEAIVQWIKREHPLKEKVLPTDWLSGKGAGAIAQAIDSLLAEVASDPDHQLRTALDAAVQRLIVRLQTDPEWERRGLELREYLQNDETLGRYVQDLWTNLRERLQDDLANEDSEVSRKVAAMGQWLGMALAGDPALRVRLNVRLQLWATQVAPDLSQFVAEHIRNTVDRWDAKEMARLVELHIGSDLQYIRINGTVVGGLIGLVLFALSHAQELAQGVQNWAGG